MREVKRVERERIKKRRTRTKTGDKKKRKERMAGERTAKTTEISKEGEREDKRVERERNKNI